MLFLFFPPLCAVCQRLLVRGESVLCIGCLSDLPLSYFWVWEENPAFLELYKMIEVERVASLMLYRSDSEWRFPIYLFKYEGKLVVGRLLSRLLGERLKESSWEVDLIIPLPLHPIKRWIRGFNQAEVIAREVAKVLRVPCEMRAVRRKRYTFTQTKRGKSERERAMIGAFAIKRGGRELLAGKRVLLIDDLLTTGATMEACGRVLLEGGVKELSVATLAYVEL